MFTNRIHLSVNTITHTPSLSFILKAVGTKPTSVLSMPTIAYRLIDRPHNRCFKKVHHKIQWTESNVHYSVTNVNKTNEKTPRTKHRFIHLNRGTIVVSIQETRKLGTHWQNVTYENLVVTSLNLKSFMCVNFCLIYESKTMYYVQYLLKIWLTKQFFFYPRHIRIQMSQLFI